MIDWPENVINDLARRRVVLFVGSGISRHSAGADGVTRPPSWEEFLSDALLRCTDDTTHIKRAIREKKYLSACDWIKRRLDDNWRNILRERFLTPQFRAAEIHSLIYKLDARFVLTPNFDTIYETFAAAESSGTVLSKNYYDDDAASTLRDNTRSILKIHGSITHPEKIVFTEKEYASARNRHWQFYKIVDALIATNTLLFLGCGIEDPDIKLALENSAFSGASPPHFIVLPSPVHEDIASSLRESRNLKVLTYGNSKKDHSSLVEGLKNLVEAVSVARDQVAIEQGW